MLFKELEEKSFMVKQLENPNENSEETEEMFHISKMCHNIFSGDSFINSTLQIF